MPLSRRSRRSISVCATSRPPRKAYQCGVDSARPTGPPLSPPPHTGLGASALLGVGALFVAKVWLPNSAPGATRAGAAEIPAEALKPVVAASGALAFGQKLEAKNLTVIRMPAGAAPEGAYSTIQQVLGQDGGAPVTLTALVNHEPILPAKISGGSKVNAPRSWST